jgi:hypothetical protein
MCLQLGTQYLEGMQLTSGKVAIHPEPKGAIVYKKAWATTMIQGKLAQYKGPWLHDTRKLAW